MSATETIAKALTYYTQHPQYQPHCLGFFFGTHMFDFTMKEYFQCKKKKYNFTYSDGFTVKITQLDCPKSMRRKDGKDRFVILSHGFGVNANYMLRYANIYMEKGYSCILFDHRGNCWSKKGQLHSMGYFEGKDIIEIAESLRKKYGKKAIIGIQGESMGSAASFMSLPEVANYTDFMVCDCGYSSMPELSKHISKLFLFVPKKKLAKAIEEHSEVKGIRYSDVVPIDRIKEAPADFPIYFTHGGGDFFVPTHMSEDMYEAKKGKKKITIYYKSFHAMSQFLHPDEYHKNVQEFLEENNID